MAGRRLNPSPRSAWVAVRLAALELAAVAAAAAAAMTSTRESKQMASLDKSPESEPAGSGDGTSDAKGGK